MKIFVICPVRGVTEVEKKSIESYVKVLENEGHKVHWPQRDTNQDDSIGLRICQDNRAAIRSADEIHVYWNENSKGSLFDLGMAFQLEKPLVLINTIQPTKTKSFENMLIAWKTA